MKIAELVESTPEYDARPAISLDQLTEPFDPDLLIDMCDNDYAKVLIKKRDLHDVLGDAQLVLAEGHMASERSELNITDDAEVDFIDGGFKIVKYSLKTHEVFFSYDFVIHISENRDDDGYHTLRNMPRHRKKNIGHISAYGFGKAWVNDTGKPIDADILPDLPSGPDIIDMTAFCRSEYPNYVMP